MKWLLSKVFPQRIIVLVGSPTLYGVATMFLGAIYLGIDYEESDAGDYAYAVFRTIKEAESYIQDGGGLI